MTKSTLQKKKKNQGPDYLKITKWTNNFKLLKHLSLYNLNAMVLFNW